MNSNSQHPWFEPKRLGFLLKLELVKGWRALVIVAATVIGFLLLVAFIMGYLGQHMEHESSFSNFVFIGGFIFTSRAFFAFHKKEWNIPALMLPASIFEKGLTGLLLTSVGWGIYTVAVYWIFSLISSGLNLLVWDFATPFFGPSRQMGWILLHYLILQSLFFLGAALFRKAALFKTVLSMMGLMTFLGLVFMLLLRLFFWEEAGVIMEMGEKEFGMKFASDPFHYQGHFRGWAVLGKTFYFGLMPLFCWTTAFFRLREIEVKDGI